MAKIEFLITGSSGFLGNILKRYLQSTSKVTTLGRGNNNDIECDLSNEQPVFNIPINNIIHVSGKAHSIPQTAEEDQIFFNVNYTGTINLTRGLENLQQLPKSFIFISTVSVYGMEEGQLIKEDHPLLGSSPYAKSKIQAEEFLQGWCSKNNVTLTILRLPLIVGVNPPGNLGAMVRLMRKGFYVGIGSGHARKSMVLAEDVAAFIPIVQNIGGIYNLTDGYHPSMQELENALSKQLNKRKPIRLPDGVIRLIARVGDVIGNKAPLNTMKFKKLTSSLTFSDAKARTKGWNPRSVIHNLPF